MLSFASQLPASRCAAGQYRAGVSNLGPAEIAMRRRSRHIGAALTIALLALVLAVDAHPLARLLIAIPATMSAVGYLQAYLGFCAAYGLRAAFNFGPLGRRQAVLDFDRGGALQIVLAGSGIGLAVALLAVAL